MPFFPSRLSIFSHLRRMAVSGGTLPERVWCRQSHNPVLQPQSFVQPSCSLFLSFSSFSPWRLSPLRSVLAGMGRWQDYVADQNFHSRLWRFQWFVFEPKCEMKNFHQEGCRKIPSRCSPLIRFPPLSWSVSDLISNFSATIFQTCPFSSLRLSSLL